MPPSAAPARSASSAASPSATAPRPTAALPCPPPCTRPGTANFTLAAGGSLSNSTSGDALATNGSGTFTVTGGTVSSGANGIAADFNGSSQVSVTGGVFTAGSGGFALEAEGTSLVKIAGGTFTAGKYGLVTYTSGIIDLFGTGFSYTVNGVTTPITSGTLPTYSSGTISGTLLNGQAFNNTPFYNRATMQVNVGTPPAATPEPSSVAALGLGVLGLAGLALKARKHRAIA